MKRSDSVILLIIPLVALVVGFWLLVLGPKRHEASKLGGQVSKLQSQVDEQKRLAESAAQAKQSFPDNYEKVVELGRAVPLDDDTASLFVQFNRLSKRAGVEFRAIDLDTSQATSASTAAPPAPPTTTTGSSSSDSGSSSTSSSDSSSSSSSSGTSGSSGESGSATPTAATAGALPTEASAASLPIGASIGPAGFPVMPYKLQFRGDFFHVADFIRELDKMVSTKDGTVSVRGRLLTIDGFSLKEDQKAGFPALVAEFSVTTYLTPSDQGVSAGATPEGPAPATPTAQPTAAPTASSAPAPTPTSAGG
jgi:hypothetical protein